MNNEKKICLLIILLYLYKNIFKYEKIIIFLIIIFFLLNNNYETFNFENYEGLNQYLSFINNNKINDKLLLDFTVNNENNNPLSIATTSYVDNYLKLIINDKKRQGGKKNIFFDSNNTAIFKIFDFGPNNLFNISISTQYLSYPWLNTNADVSDNLIVNFSSSACFKNQNSPSLYFGQNFTKKISKYGSTDLTACGYNITNLCNTQMNNAGNGIICLLYDNKNNNLYKINLILYSITNYIYSYVYFIDQLF